MTNIFMIDALAIFSHFAIEEFAVTRDSMKSSEIKVIYLSSIEFEKNRCRAYKRHVFSGFGKKACNESEILRGLFLPVFSFWKNIWASVWLHK